MLSEGTTQIEQSIPQKNWKRQPYQRCGFFFLRRLRELTIFSPPNNMYGVCGGL